MMDAAAPPQPARRPVEARTASDRAESGDERNGEFSRLVAGERADAAEAERDGIATATDRHRSTIRPNDEPSATVPLIEGMLDPTTEVGEGERTTPSTEIGSGNPGMRESGDPDAIDGVVARAATPAIGTAAGEPAPRAETADRVAAVRSGAAREVPPRPPITASAAGATSAGTAAGRGAIEADPAAPNGTEASPAGDRPAPTSTRDGWGAMRGTTVPNRVVAARADPIPLLALNGGMRDALARHAMELRLLSAPVAERPAPTIPAAIATPIGDPRPAAPTAAPQAPTPVSAVPAIAVAVADRPDAAPRRMTLRLQPASLGEVEVEVVRRAGALLIELRVDNADAARALEAERGVMEQQLRARGEAEGRAVSVAIDLRGEGRGGDDRLPGDEGNGKFTRSPGRGTDATAAFARPDPAIRLI